MTERKNNSKKVTTTVTTVVTSSDSNVSVTSPPNVDGKYDTCPNCKRFIRVYNFGNACPICDVELEKKD